MLLNKRAVSGVVVMVVMIALVISISAIAFTTTKKTVEEKIKSSEACGPNIIGKLSINSEYVCYDSAAKKFVFSINRGEIDLDKLIVAVETEIETTQFELKEDEPNTNLIPFNSKDITTLPRKNGGKTYNATNLDSVIGIEIVPVINGEQCEIADSLNEITPCDEMIFSN